jgi:hypothetical protein|tara:strand:- start:25 stop:795 length:771 start_codon:yes stop_codon:yes gene_type:complete
MPRSTDKNYLKNKIKSFLGLFNYEIKRINNFEQRFFDSVAEITSDEKKILESISKFALSSKANQWSIIQSLKHIKNKNIPGDIIECGVYKGGSLILINLFVKYFDLNKKIIGYDTFEEGFNQISEFDTDPKGRKIDKPDFEKVFFPSKQDVINNLLSCNIKNEDLPVLIKGKTEDTLKDDKNVPDHISFLRLDTDLYESTRDQLEILYPKLSKGGILHLDDYGHCPGARKAIDEYFKSENIWLHRVDYTCRLLIKD